MLQQIISDHAPAEWSNVNIFNFTTDYNLIGIHNTSDEFQFWARKVSGDFNLGVTDIYKLENPFLYAQYLLKKEEYEVIKSTRVLELFHDTARDNVSSIASGNLNWRLSRRVKFGKGVSFSPFPKYANSKSSWNNRKQRVMIIADVLVGKIEPVDSDVNLPKDDNDTTVGNKGKVYVKYDDNEFYPKIFVYYNSRYDYGY
ncbi:protein mono-ADP-ribosyltransferase TIPARP-like [Photinus pyralis]|uniref:Poly [ADP-ribose] polymerase n=1 Tax=Photinus pyralis TaxID=7054 RepID=A0A1Y1MY92_PHOPY|nr:protein mono-ADP-ribosyltransferase TIPARP-like [Photinus pyralis]XP_031329279.1 protein mono-ADP-ribosyltransferase TIPARP-like [Photinus pyralis]XP_031329280.1 protein mono-ADP-ribosyltransferase TIPARP-like [Photinus pyralis]XP_031329281.1 protein mono-ADP-ribosyltransferase TIPARP-like [Photinus pyralis]XP_031329282.1 protein mono-ADP-ribosyltransferase TIPARP-like [Photinus pyralis]XP_031329283.1 protein mono-ADP-ribosyltransferase TIPARP-like [Photinus pyralis]